MDKLCEAPDSSPGVWGHKCFRNKHPRSIPHCCACGHVWGEPVEPDIINVRTVPGDLTL